MKHKQANHAGLMTGVHSFHTTAHCSAIQEFNGVIILLKVLDRSANKQSYHLVKPLHSPKN